MISISKLDFVLVAACMFCGVAWIEQEHRTRIGLPTDVEIATSRARAAGCSDTDAAPYTESCLLFIEGRVGRDTRWRTSPTENEADPSADVPN